MQHRQDNSHFLRIEGNQTQIINSLRVTRNSVQELTAEVNELKVLIIKTKLKTVKERFTEIFGFLASWVSLVGFILTIIAFCVTDYKQVILAVVLLLVLLMYLPFLIFTLIELAKYRVVKNTNALDEIFKPNFNVGNNRNPHDIPDLSLDDSSALTENDTDNNSEHKPRIVQLTNFQEADVDDAEFDYVTANSIKNEIDTDDDMDDYSKKYVCKKCLFTQSVRRRLPWEMDGTNTEDCADQDEDIVPMSEYEENEVLHKLRTVIENDIMPVPPWVCQLYRKLCLRELKRGLKQPIFDIDNLTTSRANRQILDRYQLLGGSSGRTKKRFCSTFDGSIEHEMFESPHKSRILHPFIYRNSKSMPMWVKMCERQHAVNGVLPSRASIDYCYVRPHHIAAVNNLLQNNFWPGIDMSECLSYPDFSIVALYKKLVIGCAFLVPDVGHCAAYVSFMAVRPGWQRAGIATFMLYHLTQTCMGKDITLHVSASNPAICLYQKFGFKIEEVILDFYEKYLPKDSKQSKHAFFLGLRR